MSAEKPRYLAELPKERSGVYAIVVIAVVLAIALLGAWKLYVGTVIGWEKRFNPDRDSAVPIGYVRDKTPSEAELAEVRLRQKEIKFDRCIDGVPFRKLAGGGWENIPNLNCTVSD